MAAALASFSEEAGVQKPAYSPAGPFIYLLSKDSHQWLAQYTALEFRGV
jgi:hypothetical protein